MELKNPFILLSEKLRLEGGNLGEQPELPWVSSALDSTRRGISMVLANFGVTDAAEGGKRSGMKPSRKGWESRLEGSGLGLRFPLLLGSADRIIDRKLAATCERWGGV